jgi:hypothetical protein
LAQLAEPEPPAPKLRTPGAHQRRIAWLVLSELAAIDAGEPPSQHVKRAYKRAQKRYAYLIPSELALLHWRPRESAGKRVIPRQYSDAWAWAKAWRDATLLHQSNPKDNPPFDRNNPDELAIKLAIEHVQTSFLRYVPPRP